MPKRTPPFPAVLLYHQHNSQWHIGKSEAMGFTGDPYQAFAPVLATMGYAVIVPDHLGFEERRPKRLLKDDSYHANWLNWYNQMAYCLVKNELVLARVLNDCDLALSILLNDARVRNDDISVLGHSMGGNIGMFHSALNTRIRNSCISGAVCSYRKKMENGTGIEMTMVVPGIGDYEVAGVLQSICPRRLYVVASKKDKCTADSSEIHKELKEHYGAAGKAMNLYYSNTAGGHALDKVRFDMIVKWFKDML